MLQESAISRFFGGHTWSFISDKIKIVRANKSQSVSSVPHTADFCLKTCDLCGLPPISVRYWPAYSNPYQSLFYGLPDHRFAAEPGDAAAALSELTRNLEQRVCFHVHWLNFLFKRARKRGDDYSVFDEFLANCRLIREKGGVVAWTVHNLQEHECPDPEFELKFRRELAQIADIVIVHGDKASAAAAESFGVAPGKIVNVPHGSYIGVYQDVVDRDTARSRVDAPKRETILANVGALRAYKGLQDLIPIISRLEKEGASVGLLLAGNITSVNVELIAELSRNSEAIRFHPGRVDDEHMQNYFNAADFVVLPYRSILTSGSAILAFSFARPVIAPAIGCLTELIDDGVNGFLYDPASSDGLMKALLRAVETDGRTRAQMSEASFARATSLRWSESRSRFIEAIAKKYVGAGTQRITPQAVSCAAEGNSI
jgi:beta-1,4-mannosyltransferase